MVAGAGEYQAEQVRTSDGGWSWCRQYTYRAEIAAFSQALLDSRDTHDSALAGLRGQMVIEACYESSRVRREVQVEPASV